jgi:methionine sulfoxide reductase heme-binding subunit
MAQIWWYSARASGLVAWVLMAMSVIWGLVLSTKLRPPGVRPAWTLDLHRFLGGVAVAFVGVHIASVMLDSSVHFGARDVLVPFASGWRPLGVAWGIVGLYLLLAVELSSLARKHLSPRIWRRLHFLSFPLFLSATWHLLSAGTDAHSGLVLMGVAGLGTAVAVLTAWRIRSSARNADSAVRGTRIPARVPRTAMMETVRPQEEVLT